jgi:hypothetical protein
LPNILVFGLGGTTGKSAVGVCWTDSLCSSRSSPLFIWFGYRTLLLGTVVMMLKVWVCICDLEPVALICHTGIDVFVISNVTEHGPLN